MTRLRWTRALATGVLAALLYSSAQAVDGAATLTLRIVDAPTDEPVPARVEIRDAQGAFHIAEDAVRFGGDLRNRLHSIA